MKYELINNKTNEKVGVFYFLKDAENEVLKLCLGSDKFSIFDFEIKEVDDKPQGANEQIKSFEDAVVYLEMEEGGYYSSILDTALENREFQKRIDAYTKLLTIATAWNKMDGFVADWEDIEQERYYPSFEVSEDYKNIDFACVSYNDTSLFISFGSRLCFKTRERAEQFGKQFIDLWNDLLK